MGKPRTLSKRAKNSKKKCLRTTASGNGSVTALQEPDVEQLLDEASEYLDVYNYEDAKVFCQRALEIDNDNVRALETTASLLLECGDIDNAKHCLGRAIILAPDSGHAKYLSMAQLMEGREALQLYRRGLEILTRKLAEEEDSNTLKHELSNVYCAIAELFMTDLCDTEEAEGECEICLGSATSVDKENPEAWQTKARFHLIKNEFEDAKFCIGKSLALWLPAYTAVLENKTSEVDQGQELDPVEGCPLLYSTRISAVKILLELEDWDTANEVLNGLVEEDEDVVETWYLLGWLNKLRADFEQRSDGANEGETSDDATEGYKCNARYFLHKAKDTHYRNPTCDKQMVAHIGEILEMLGPTTGQDEFDHDDGDNDWTTTDEDDEEKMN